MWLPADERALLLGYYVRLKGFTNSLEFDDPAWAPVIAVARKRWRWARTISKRAASVPARDGVEPEEPGPQDDAKLKAAISDRVKLTKRVRDAREHLAVRGLVGRAMVVHGRSLIWLTAPGYDLARAYASWFWRTGEWFEQLKGHWVWLLVTFLLGILTEVVRRWLLSSS